MWPPHSVKTWPTPACFSTRATSRPPVRSATELGQHLGREPLDLLALLGRRDDWTEDDVVAAGVAESRELLAHLVGRADDAVLLRERPEVLRVAFAQHLGPHALGGLPVATERHERQMRRDEAVQLATGRCGRRPNLVEALCVALRLHDVRDPPIALAAGTRQCRVGAAADPDRRPGLLHGLGIERHARKLRKAAFEARRRVAPERTHDVDRLAHAGAALTMRNAAHLELL